MDRFLALVGARGAFRCGHATPCRGSALGAKRPGDRGRPQSALLTTIGDLGPFRYRIPPNDPMSCWPGFALTCVGLALTVWARRALGPFWASRIVIKEGHRLIQNGPYRYLRHPIYSGILLAAAGSMIADCDIGGVSGFALIAASFILKPRRDEHFVAAIFGEQWRTWRERTWALVPHSF